MSGSTVLIVDDERTLARAVKAFLAEAGYEAEVAGDAEQALRMIETLRPDVVFSDVRLPGMNGIDLLKRIREFDAGIPVVIMTAHGTIEGAVEAVKLGAFDYLKKPVDLEELKLLADRARETTQLRQELSYYRRQAARDVPMRGCTRTLPRYPSRTRAGSADREARRDAPGADHRRNRHRQGSHRPHDPRGERPRIEAIHRGELYRPARHADGIRALRPRARRLH